MISSVAEDSTRAMGRRPGKFMDQVPLASFEFCEVSLVARWGFEDTEQTPEGLNVYTVATRASCAPQAAGRRHASRDFLNGQVAALQATARWPARRTYN